MAKQTIVNTDDEYGRRLAQEVQNKVISYGLEDDRADFSAKNLHFSKSGVQFEVLADAMIKRVKFAMPGEYSVYNALGAVAVAMSVGVSGEAAIDGINHCKGVRGRGEVLYDGDFTIICDYAHTADGLEKVLKALKPQVKGRLITLFGCAGERDWSKREQMGETVGSFSDMVVLTSDNPRKEDPLEILAHATVGLSKTKAKVKTIADRYGAIVWAMDQLKPDDLLLLAGKGHEDYQVLYSATIYFDEHKIVEEILQKKGLQ